MIPIPFKKTILGALLLGGAGAAAWATWGSSAEPPPVLASLPADQRPLLFVGDGITDLEAKDVVDLFVGFGGVARRKAVQENADAYISENSLLPVLDIGLTPEEKQTLAQDQRFRHLLPKQAE